MCHWQVKFLQGTDGNVPWVWVMGEHKDDLSYEELVSSPIDTHIIEPRTVNFVLLVKYYRFVGVKKKRWRGRDRVSWS